ncbi:MAG: SDR family oxidoreductase [Anaerolineae bacterium]
MAFTGKRALVTGGSSGIGKATAKALASAGAHVCIVARTPAKIAEAQEEIRGVAADASKQDIIGKPADVSDYAQARAVVRELVQEGWEPDLLFNFAGIAHPGYFHELPLDVFRRTMETNFFGTLHMCKLVAPLMMRRGSGHILNTSSVAGFIGVFGYTAYGASKFAVRGFTDVLRSELKPYGVKVSILFPPDTDTPQLWEENKIKPAETRAIAGNVKVMSPEEVARQLLQGVARGQYIILPGLESKLVYMAAGMLGAKIHWLLDRIVQKAQQERGGPPAVTPAMLAELYSDEGK